MDLMIINPPRVCPYRKGYQIAKRMMDVGLCLLAIPFILPLMAMISILIYLDSPGPVMFVQWRTGKGGKRFRMYKFRTMVSNAEELKAKYAHLNELTLPDFKITNDPRITPVGRFLRKTSLDELPQILNILKGEMSWVGPRPTSFSADTYRLWHTERLEVVPGLTGLWQVSGRSDLDFDDRLRLDIAYIERQSLWLDFQILARTAGAVLLQRGAH
jgi:lipopolysaccharide/colanic/teichoic acid biosynthesis glycosyltransferase